MNPIFARALGGPRLHVVSLRITDEAGVRQPRRGTAAAPATATGTAGGSPRPVG